MPSFLIGFFFLFVGVAHSWAENPSLRPAKIINSYNGGYKEDYPQELVRVQSYIQAVQSEIATQLGLQYGQGFIHPVSIRFDDGVPSINENPFFYVQVKASGP